MATHVPSHLHVRTNTCAFAHMYHTVHYSSLASLCFMVHFIHTYGALHCHLMCHFVFHGILHTCGAPLCHPLPFPGVCAAHAHVLCYTLDSPVSDIGLHAAHHSCLRADGGSVCYVHLQETKVPCKDVLMRQRILLVLHRYNCMYNIIVHMYAYVYSTPI